MSRFETKFAELAAKKEGAFVPFVTLCDPTFDRSFEIICTLVENGADALELGFPFSDPLLDGPVIQAANNRALNAGHSTEDSFKLLAKVRSKYPDIPISLLLCANLIFAKGLDNFYQRCAEVGVDAVLVADIPLLAKEDYVQAAKKHGIQPVFICPPNADAKTVQGVAENSEGYTYLVSRAGVTSAENQACRKLRYTCRTTQSPQGSTNSTRFWYCSTCSSERSASTGCSRRNFRIRDSKNH